MLVPKFELGQKVYAVSSVSDTRRVHKECDVCNSTGLVKVVGREENFMCPACEGKYKTEHYGFKYVISYSRATIGKIDMQVYASKYKNRYKSEVKYMLEETGVGSGTLWYENRLFGTKEEANEFCEKYMPANYYDDLEPILKE